MICPVCRDNVVNGKCTFCGYELTKEEMRSPEYAGSSVNSNQNMSGINDCVGHHDDHNVNNATYTQRKDGAYTSTGGVHVDPSGAETIDLMSGKRTSGFAGASSNNSSSYAGGTTGNASSSSYDRSSYSSTSAYDERQMSKMFTLSIVLLIVAPILSVILSYVGYTRATTEEYKKKFKTFMIVGAVLFVLSIMGTFVFPILTMIITSFL